MSQRDGVVMLLGVTHRYPVHFSEPHSEHQSLCDSVPLWLAFALRNRLCNRVPVGVALLYFERHWVTVRLCFAQRHVDAIVLPYCELHSLCNRLPIRVPLTCSIGHRLLIPVWLRVGL